jgi:hypothetical protein
MSGEQEIRSHARTHVHILHTLALASTNTLHDHARTDGVSPVALGHAAGLAGDLQGGGMLN